MAKRTLARIFRWVGQIAVGICLALWLNWLVAPITLPKANLWQSTAVAALPPTVAQESASSLVEQGLQQYTAGRFAEAAIAWQQAVDAFQAQGNPLQQAQTLNYLALANQELGKLTQAESAIADSLQITDQFTAPPNQKQQLRAQALNTRGSLQLAQGQAEQALATWQQAAALYTQLGDATGKAGSLINQAQAQQALGFYLRARKTLTEAQQALQAQPDLSLRAIGLRKLGDVLRAVGDLDTSEQLLKQSLALTQQNSQSQAEVLLSLGNTARAKQNLQSETNPHRAEALSYYEAAADATSGMTAVQAQLNHLSLLLESQQEATALPLTAQIQPAIAQLPLNRSTVYAQINFVQSLIRLHESETPGAPTWTEIAQIAAQAVAQAQQLNDPQAEAYAIGSLGKLYEKTHQWSEAQSLTEQALLLSQSIHAPDIVYQWQWQMGRLLKQQGNRTGAIAAYTDSLNTLRLLRNDLVAINPDVQFSFRESVEPVYRQLVSLLLQPKDAEVSQQNLQQAQEVIESLQLAQLENFFQEACLNARATQVDRVDAEAAVLYSIILDDRLEVILSLANQPLQHFSTPIPQNEMETMLEKMRRSLRRTSSSEERLEIAQRVYNLLLKPSEAAIAASKVKTLVFVLDGTLQSVPLSALHDGQQYLIEKYSLALAPGLQLLESQPLEREQLKVLMGGLTEASQGFSALPGVESEIQQITAALPAEVLINQTFTSQTLQDQISATSFPVVHLATHGQFSSNAKDTFILAWDSPINVKQLDELLRSRERQERRPIELLVLSACQTAAGDRRAALGLAGVAVRSGARSTLATLWSVDDESTAQLMVQFYQGLAQTKLTKAEALRQAQLSLQQQPDFQHPYYWAPFVLVGNWL